MSDNQQAIPSSLQTPVEDEVNLLDLLIVLAKHKRMIMGVTFAAALLAAGSALFMPNVYTAKAKILPPQTNQSSAVNSIMLAQLGGLASMAGGALGLKDPNALYVAMLKSSNIMERLVQRFDLKKIYGEKFMVDTLNSLEKKSAIVAGKDGVITIEVDDEDPQRAAALANTYVEELNKLMQTLALTEASLRRHFFETQMKSAKDKLTDAEVALDRTPNTSLRYLDVLRNFKYRESVYEILAKQFEMAKLDEAKDSPLIQVLDKAVPPEKKSKPKRAQIVIIAALAALFFTVILVLVREVVRRAKDQPEQAERLRELRSVFRWRP